MMMKPGKRDDGDEGKDDFKREEHHLNPDKHSLDPEYERLPEKKIKYTQEDGEN